MGAKRCGGVAAQISHSGCGYENQWGGVVRFLGSFAVKAYFGFGACALADAIPGSVGLNRGAG